MGIWVEWGNTYSRFRVGLGIWVAWGKEYSKFRVWLGIWVEWGKLSTVGLELGWEYG